jgi:hypothetical protein
MENGLMHMMVTLLRSAIIVRVFVCNFALLRLLVLGIVSFFVTHDITCMCSFHGMTGSQSGHG